MNNEEMRKTIEFILEQQASTSVKQDKNTEDIAGLTKDVSRLTKDVKELTQNVDNLAAVMRMGFAEMRMGFAETREALDSLITSMLNTKRLTEQVAELNLHTSKRVTAIEKKVKELAKKSK